MEWFSWWSVGILILVVCLRVLKEYERGVIMVLGRFIGIWGPGPVLIVPGLFKMVTVDLRVLTLDVPPQDIITKDNISVKVDAVVYFMVTNPEKAILQVENYHYATRQLAQTTLRSVLGQWELDDLLSHREKINASVQAILDEDTEPWGIKVTKVEVKNVDLPDTMMRAIAKQAEAERERRAKVIHADGELQASEKLSQAAGKIEAHPSAMQLRYLQTLVEVSAEKNSTLIFPVPVDMLKGLAKFAEGYKN